MDRWKSPSSVGWVSWEWRPSSTMRSPNRCLMATPGEALRIGCKDLQRIMLETPGVRGHLLNYVHALLI